MKLLIVGMDADGHVGRFFLEGAREAGLDVRIADVGGAMAGNPLIRRVLWRLLKRPIRLEQFSRQVLGLVAEWKPDVVLGTGLCPLTAATLAEIRKGGAKVVNYSTDDPWNPSHRSRWFLEALPEYDHVFSTRKANLADFKRIGCDSVSWLPFGYHPAVHHPVDRVEGKWQSDVAFVGGADRDRVPMLAQMIREGYELSLWGGYWERFAETRPAARGMADSETLCKVVGSTKCALTLVRRSNRDGHAMRSYEVAAIGGPALAEDTEEHREILGEEGDTALYFTDAQQLAEKSRWLIAHPEEAAAMGARLARRIRASPNTYADRLHAIISHTNACESSGTSDRGGQASQAAAGGGPLVSA